MTNDELNRAVAEARGWTNETRTGYNLSAAGTYIVWLNKDGHIVDRRLFDVCTDPAAWGALFEEMAQAKKQPRIRQTLRGDFEAAVNRDEPFTDGDGYCDEYAVAYDSLVGRALALAFLKAEGVL